jgi:RimJ/RimL family protein N-acetyltransferase
VRFANEYGVCEITTLPGSPQVAVSHAVFIYPEYRGTGKGSVNHVLRLQRLKAMGYNYVICTVRKGNAPQEHLMEKFGWTKLAGFKSSATEHDVVIYGKEI